MAEEKIYREPKKWVPKERDITSFEHTSFGKFVKMLIYLNAKHEIIWADKNSVDLIDQNGFIRIVLEHDVVFFDMYGSFVSL